MLTGTLHWEEMLYAIMLLSNAVSKDGYEKTSLILHLDPGTMRSQLVVDRRDSGEVASETGVSSLQGGL